MKELMERWLGQVIYLRTGGLKVMVEVKDVKMAWGRVRLLVEPVRGDGTVWVEENSVEIVA